MFVQQHLQLIDESLEHAPRPARRAAAPAGFDRRRPRAPRPCRRDPPGTRIASPDRETSAGGTRCPQGGPRGSRAARRTPPPRAAAARAQRAAGGRWRSVDARARHRPTCRARARPSTPRARRVRPGIARADSSPRPASSSSHSRQDAGASGVRSPRATSHSAAGRRNDCRLDSAGSASDRSSVGTAMRKVVAVPLMRFPAGHRSRR